MILSDELIAFCRQHETADTHLLALEASKYPGIDIPRAIQQIRGLQIAKHKLPTFYRSDKIAYPPHLSLEQCSSEKTAAYKATIAGKGETMVDLTGGLGIDLYFISRSYAEATYVEQQKDLVELASYNFDILGAKNIHTVHADGTDYLEKMNRVDLIFLDPARRDNIGNKTVLIADCTPNLLNIQDTLREKADKVIIKLSPMLDISMALQDLQGVSDVHIVSVRNECKELLFVMQEKNRPKETIFHCINMEHDTVENFIFTKQQEKEAHSEYTHSLEKYLYEPNASLMKAGAYNLIGKQFGLKKLHPNTHLYTSDTLVENFPGRVFKIECAFSLNKREIKQHLAQVKEANIAARNFPLKPEELRKRLKLKDGGNRFIFGVTLSDEKRTLILCDRFSSV